MQLQTAKFQSTGEKKYTVSYCVSIHITNFGKSWEWPTLTVRCVIVRFYEFT